MNISFTTQDIFTGKHDAIVLFTFEAPSPQEARFVQRVGNGIAMARSRKEFSGKSKEIYLETRAEQLRFCALAGLGKRDELTTASLRETVASAVRQLQDKGATHVAIEALDELDAQEVGQAVAEGALLASYRFTRYKTRKLEDLKQIAALTIVSDRSGVGVKNGVDIGRTIAESCNMARDLQNTPSQDLTPAMFAQAAAALAKKEKIGIKIYDRKALEKGDFGGILAVGRGSVNEPRLVVLEHAPKKAKKTICIVGKGITFDTGGISIKPGPHMADMKFDMSGAAVVFAVMRNMAKLNLPIRVIGIMGLAENMPDGGAYKPGDVVKTKSGLTIEVDNTDAEGRVVLSDCLHLGTTYKPEYMIDLATLTGAVIVALGDVAAGLMGNDDAVIAKVKNAAELSGERVWHLPLWDDYERDIESKIADVKNVGLPRMAGTVTAGMFLKQFVGETPWAHLDIAGVAWADPRDNYFTASGTGGTGYGVRLVTELLRRSID